MSRWHEDCFGRCTGCPSCLTLDNNNGDTLTASSKRFVTVGSVRYGLRLGAVSPPPPGAGPRYRSQCCWPSSGGGPVSRIPLLATSPINSHDIYSCVNRVRMAEDDASEQSDRGTVRDQVLHSTKTLFKNQLQLRRRGPARPQVYARLCECDSDRADILATLDRLPRFRFGGNRASGTKQRDKKEQDQRLKELSERFKRGPVPPPRVRHTPAKPPAAATSANATTTSTSQQQTQLTATQEAKEGLQQQQASAVAATAALENEVRFPIRSVSFSQVDYSTDDNKYVRRRNNPQEQQVNQAANYTLPRNKHHSKNTHKDSIDHTTQTPLAKPEQLETSSSNCSEHSSNSNKQDEPENDTVIKRFSAPEKLDDKQIRNSAASDDSAQEKRRDKSRRRKGMYISQWPNTYENTENFVEKSDFANAFPETDIPRLHISSESRDEINIEDQAPTSPDENLNSLDWSSTPSSAGRPTLSAQNSEERDNNNSYFNNNKSNTQLVQAPHQQHKNIQFIRADSLSEGEPDLKVEHLTIGSSDVSDCESRASGGGDVPRRYSKRPLRGPYGQMLEAEMKKPEGDRKNFSTDLKFLEDLSSNVGTCSVVSLSSSSSMGAADPKPKYVTRIRGTSNHSLDDSQLKGNSAKFPVTKRKVSVDGVTVPAPNEQEQKVIVCHQRTTSSPSKLEGFSTTEVSNELLEQLLRGSSEQLTAEANLQRQNDTRTHVVVELYETERSYVEALQTIVSKYLEPLKSTENAQLLDAASVDEIFYQIPTLLTVHQSFLDELKNRLDRWDIKQKVGDVFLELFAKPGVMEAYSCYVNNWKRARDLLKNAQATKPAFAKFLEANAREHKGKLPLDSLLIKPIQKFPKYELLILRLIKHTDGSHPDHELLLGAQKSLHDELLKLNCTEKEAVELEQLREIESVIEGLIELVSSDRQYLRHDFVNMTAAGGTRKERALFLFTDLLLITSIKRRSGTIRRPPPTSSANMPSVTSTLEANKFKLLMKISLDDLEIVRPKDENYKQTMMEIENLTEDISILNQIAELSWNMHCPHITLDENIREMLSNLNKQLADQQNSDNQLSCLDLTLNTIDGPETISIVFAKPEKRAAWEETFNEAKHKLAMSGDRRPCPELVAFVPIRKTRAGLQFTCAAPTMSDIGNDVWVCNSDGYVGQVCVLSLQSEPATVTSCNGVCNARILCVASVPGIQENAISQSKSPSTEQEQVEDHSTIQFDSESSSDDEGSVEDPEDGNRTSGLSKSLESGSTDSDDADNHHSTMWLGTEDGCIHVYNSSDNIRIKKNKIRLQHGSAILSIIYLDNKVYVSLANGEITIYERDCSGTWDTSQPTSVAVGSSTTPVTRMLPTGSKLWCACGNTVKILNVQTLVLENSFVVNNDSSKTINAMVFSGHGIWLSLQNSAIVKCIHSISYEFLCDVNVAPAVTKMLTCCDDIIRQHKAACLRVTSLLACKDLLWIGTSAGVLLTMPLPHITATSTKLTTIPSVVGIPHGHTGHVRFLTFMEIASSEPIMQKNSAKGKPDQRGTHSKLLVISGGDGYEDFRSSTVSEVAGREDSTNHLLLWNI